MAEIRTAREAELPELLAFERRYTENDDSLREFRDAYETWPELFVVYEEDGEIVGEASGYARSDASEGEDDEVVVLASIAVRNDRQGEGIGRRTLTAFEDRATTYAETVSVAAAADVEGFYEKFGYEPKAVLLQVAESDLPDDYEERAEIVAERRVDSETRFLYAGFGEYDPDLRAELKERFAAFEANAIYEKELTE